MQNPPAYASGEEITTDQVVREHSGRTPCDEDQQYEVGEQRLYNEIRTALPVGSPGARKVHAQANPDKPLSRGDSWRCCATSVMRHISGKGSGSQRLGRSPGTTRHREVAAEGRERGQRKQGRRDPAGRSDQLSRSARVTRKIEARHQVRPAI